MHYSKILDIKLTDEKIIKIINDSIIFNSYRYIYFDEIENFLKSAYDIDMVFLDKSLLISKSPSHDLTYSLRYQFVCKNYKRKVLIESKNNKNAQIVELFFKSDEEIQKFEYDHYRLLT